MFHFKNCTLKSSADATTISLYHVVWIVRLVPEQYVYLYSSGIRTDTDHTLYVDCDIPMWVKL